MTLITKILLTLYYPVLGCVGRLRRLIGRNPMVLREPDQASFWIVRPTNDDLQSYFSQSSPTEGRPATFEGSTRKTDRGAARLLTWPLLLLARLCAPPRSGAAQAAPSAADRDKNIPDEIYTLW